MRAVLIIMIFARAAAAGPPMHPINDRHFDHEAHDKILAERARSTPECTRCHPTSGKAGQLTDKGNSATVDHALCAGSGCHGDSFAKDTRCESIKAAGQAKVCATCHIKETCFAPEPASVDRKRAVFSHGRHVPMGEATAPVCADCHTAEAGTAAADAHAACAACHNGGSNPAMTDCAGCHRGGDRAQIPPPRADLSFEHGTHATASKQRACIACHSQPVRDDRFSDVPATMLGCQSGCHDGKRAFAATGTNCTRCHRGADPAKPAQSQPFSHAAHAQRGAHIEDCGACHASKPDGTLLEPLAGKDHQPCAASGCHQPEFASKETKICGVCHDAVAPWVHAKARANEHSATHEWFTGIDHAAHLARGATNAACEQCHPMQMAGKAAPRGHGQCAPCHGKGQAPAMTDCAACHTRERPAHAAESAWSVTATFQHATHVDDPRTHSATACTECHASVATARDLASVRAPKMQTCDSCHDGKSAFKSTGFGCAKCHRKPLVKEGA